MDEETYGDIRRLQVRVDALETKLKATEEKLEAALKVIGEVQGDVLPFKRIGPQQYCNACGEYFGGRFLDHVCKAKRSY